MNKEEQQRFRNEVYENGIKGASMEFGISYMTAKRLNEKYKHVKAERMVREIMEKEKVWFYKNYKRRIYLYVDGEKVMSSIYVDTFKLAEKLWGYQFDKELGFRYSNK